MVEEESDNWDEDGTGSGSQRSDPSEDTQQVEIEEVNNGGNPAAPSSEVEPLATFREEEGPLTALILPVIKRGQTSWRVRIHSDGVQGMLFESHSTISDGEADALGMSPGLQNRINEGLRYAHQEFDLPQELRGQQRAKRSLSDLEDRMDDSAR